jgi:hypothetical protein
VSRFGKSHVDGDSEWVYKVRVEWDGFDCKPVTDRYRSNLRRTITLRITRDCARGIVEALQHEKGNILPGSADYLCKDQRNRGFTVNRSKIEYETDLDDLSRTWTYTHEMTDDFGPGSWQAMLVQLQRWVG